MTLDAIAIQLAQQTASTGGPLGISWVYWVMLAAIMLVSFVVSNTLKSKFQKYSRVPIRYTGAQVAQAMLRENGITDVKVISTPGQLTDHYDPIRKTVNLSEAVYGMNSIAAAAVAAHEVGHAVQHKKAYAWLTLRSKMVPAVSFSSSMLNYLMIASLLGAGLMGNPLFLWLWVGLFGVTTLFSMVTLPVEFDASRRALVWLESSGVSSSMDHHQAKDALFWAAMTYVVAAVGSLAQFAYFLLMALSRRD